MPVTLTRFLTSDPAAAALDSVHHYQVQSWLAAWLAPFLIVGLAALVLWRYRRETRLTGLQRGLLVTLRTLAYATALIMLARPVLEISGEGVLDGPVPVVLDASLSMQLEDAAARARYDAGSDLARQLQAAAADFPGLRLQPYRAGAAFTPLDLAAGSAATAPDAEVTSLTRMLESGRRDHLGSYIPGVILITDGAHNAAELVDGAVAAYRAAGIPVYTVGVGEERSRDQAIPFLLADDVVFLGETVRLYVNLVLRGYEGQGAEIRIFLNDKQIGSQPLTLGEDTELTVPVDYVPDRTGNFVLSAEIVPKADEVTTLNNVYRKNIRVIDEKIRVLSIFGTPSREYLYLRTALERDNRVQQRIFLQSIDPRVISSGADPEMLAALPDSAPALSADYDLVFLSGINVMLLPPATQEALAGFVRDHAGGLVLISDTTLVPWSLRGTPLEPLVPVTIAPGFGRGFADEMGSSLREPYRFRLTDEGAANPLVLFSGQAEENRHIWESFPPIYRIYSGGRLKPGAVSLLVSFRNQQEADFPAIVQQTYGRGAVLFMGFDTTWRWRREYGDRYFREYWSKVVQYLGLPHLLNEASRNALFVSQETAAVGEKVTITAKLTNPDFSPYVTDTVRLSRQNGEARDDLQLLPVPARPGMYRAVDWPREAGEYSYHLPADYQAPPATLRVIQQSREFLDSSLDSKRLMAISATTGGQYQSLEETAARALLQTIHDGRRPQPLQFRASIWDNTLLLLLCIGFFGGEWLCRKLFYLD